MHAIAVVPRESCDLVFVAAAFLAMAVSGCKEEGSFCEEVTNRVIEDDASTPDGFSAISVLEMVGSGHDALLTWRANTTNAPSGASIDVSVVVERAADPARHVVTEQRGDTRDDLMCGAELRVPVAVEVRTGDGAIDDVFVGDLVHRPPFGLSAFTSRFSYDELHGWLRPVAPDPQAGEPLNTWGELVIDFVNASGELGVFHEFKGQSAAELHEQAAVWTQGSERHASCDEAERDVVSDSAMAPDGATVLGLLAEVTGAYETSFSWDETLVNAPSGVVMIDVLVERGSGPATYVPTQHVGATRDDLNCGWELRVPVRVTLTTSDRAMDDSFATDLIYRQWGGLDVFEAEIRYEDLEGWLRPIDPDPGGSSGSRVGTAGMLSIDLVAGEGRVYVLHTFADDGGVSEQALVAGSWPVAED